MIPLFTVFVLYVPSTIAYTIRNACLQSIYYSFKGTDAVNFGRESKQEPGNSAHCSSLRGAIAIVAHACMHL